jgi:hypothetical protein
MKLRRATITASLDLPPRWFDDEEMKDAVHAFGIECTTVSESSDQTMDCNERLEEVIFDKLCDEIDNADIKIGCYDDLFKKGTWARLGKREFVLHTQITTGDVLVIVDNIHTLNADDHPDIGKAITDIIDAHPYIELRG